MTIIRLSFCLCYWLSYMTERSAAFHLTDVIITKHIHYLMLHIHYSPSTGATSFLCSFWGSTEEERSTLVMHSLEEKCTQTLLQIEVISESVFAVCDYPLYSFERNTYFISYKWAKAKKKDNLRSSIRNSAATSISHLKLWTNCVRCIVGNLSSGLLKKNVWNKKNTIHLEKGLFGPLNIILWILSNITNSVIHLQSVIFYLMQHSPQSN